MATSRPMQMREAGDDPHVRIAIQRTASYLSKDQQHHCLGSDQKLLSIRLELFIFPKLALKLSSIFSRNK